MKVFLPVFALAGLAGCPRHTPPAATTATTPVIRVDTPVAENPLNPGPDDALTAPGPNAVAPDPIAPDAAIIGPKWILESLGGDLPDGQAEAWFHIDANGVLDGYGGCNRIFSRTVSVTGDAVAFGGIGATRRACPDLAVEQDVVRALDATASWIVEGEEFQVLRLSSDAGELATFTGAAYAPDEP